MKHVSIAFSKPLRAESRTYKQEVQHFSETVHSLVDLHLLNVLDCQILGLESIWFCWRECRRPYAQSVSPFRVFSGSVIASALSFFIAALIISSFFVRHLSNNIEFFKVLLPETSWCNTWLPFHAEVPDLESLSWTAQTWSIMHITLQLSSRTIIVLLPFHYIHLPLFSFGYLTGHALQSRFQNIAVVQVRVLLVFKFCRSNNICRNGRMHSTTAVLILFGILWRPSLVETHFTWQEA